MCETIANVPVSLEETNLYMVTQDMIDAAMTEHYTFEDGGESDEEQSSREDVEMQSSSNDDTTDKDLNQTPVSSSDQNLSDNSKASCAANNVLVIDTGLEQNGLNITSETGDSHVEKDQCGKIELPIQTASTSSNCPRSCNQLEDEITNEIDDVRHDELPLLTQMLNEKLPNRDVGALPCVESIDLCNSDSEEFSADDAPGGEIIDDKLQSVMESNLMAEFGITLNETPSEPVPSVPVMPKISVKNIGHISKNDFEKIPTNTLDLRHVNVEKRRSVNVSSSSPEISIAGRDVSSSIQLNKIAVPNKTFVNSQGQKMKCVYVRAPTTLPINNVKKDDQQQKMMSNKSIKYVLAPSLKNGSLQLAPAPVDTVKRIIPIVKKRPSDSKTLQIAPKLIKGPESLKGSLKIHRFDKDQSNDKLVQSLLFHSLKTPYVPSNLYATQTTYNCADCNDRFVLESSLKHHLARRTIVICYWCRLCKVEIQCFNRCVFLSHLRGHNISRKTIDTACISFSPIPAEMTDAGLVSTYFTESITSVNLPKEDRILKFNVSDENDGTSKSAPGEWQTTTSLITYSNKNKLSVAKGSNNVKTTSVQSRSVGTSTSIAAPITTSLLLSNKANSVLIQNQDQPIKIAVPVDKNMTFYNPMTVASATSTNGTPNAIPPNVVCEMVAQENSEVMEENFNEVVDVDSLPIDSASPALQSPPPSVATKQSNNVSKHPKIGHWQNRHGEKIVTVKRHCHECNVNCINITKHLNGINRPLNPQLTCEVCQLILPTRCALKIHLRIHMQIPPFKCPDCGKDFAAWDELHAHLKFSCGHLAKCMRFMCVACKTHFPSTASLANHISNQHSRDIYKCTACPVAFFNKASLTKHLFTHPQNSAIGMDYKQCSICPKKVVPTERFMDHVREHIINRAIMIYGYKCPMCCVIFANKMPFIIHQIKERSELEAKSDSVSKHPLKKTSQPVNSYQSFGSDLEDEPEIVSKYPEAFNGNTEEKDPLSLDDCEFAQGQTVNEKKEELCIVCKKNYVVLLPDIDLNEQSLCCRQCVRPLDDLTDQTSDHFGKTRPRIISKTKNRELSLTKRMSSDVSVKSETPNGVRDSIESSPPKKKNKKKSSASSWDIVDPSDPTQIQGQVITSKSPNELVCSKCDFTAEFRDVFLEHIRVHRTDPNTFQCIECGLCFVVLPSLERHLQMNHGINNVNDYIEKNPYSLPQIASLEEEILVDENQCRVCRQIFDSPSSLEKHFRTHGMAFMNSLSKSP